MGTWRSTRSVRKWRSTKTSRLCRPRSHSSSRVHMFLEARRGAVLPRRVPSRTSSVVLVDALRQRTSPRCLATWRAWPLGVSEVCAPRTARSTSSGARLLGTLVLLSLPFKSWSVLLS